MLLKAALYLFLLGAPALLWRTLSWRPRRLPDVAKRDLYLFGHRGVREGQVENTVAAFRAAFEAGLDGIEFDVQRSLDGELVLYHDFHLPDGRSVARLDMAQLREAEPQLATLEELFELARAYPGKVFNLELKTYSWTTYGLESAVVRAVRTSGLAGRVLISSFNPLSLLRVRLRAPELRTALLYSPELPDGWYELGAWLHVDALHPEHGLVTAVLRERSKRRGLMLNTWTVNEAAEVRRLCALGVNGLMADDPARLKQAAGRSGT